MKQLLIRMKNKFTDNRNEMIRTLLLSEGFGFCFSLSCILGYRLDKYDTVCGSAGMIISGLLLAILAGIPIAILITAIGTYIEDRTTGVVYETADIRKVFAVRWAVCALVLLICWLPVFLAYFPAVFSYDAEAQLYQVISGNYSTHHPLIHTLLMGLCMKIGYAETGINAGMALYAVVQMVLMAVMLGWAMAEMLRLRIRRIWFVLYCVFVCFFPVHPILAVSTTKDVLFAGFTVVFTLLLRRIAVEGKNGAGNFIRLGIMAVLLLLFRNNAMYAVVAMIAILLVCMLFCKALRKDKYLIRLMLTLAAALVVSTVIGMGIKTALHAEAGSPREALSIPIQQLARVKVLHGDELDVQTGNDLEQLISTEWADRYDEHLADPIKERISMKQPALLVKTWIKLGCKYPGDYIDAWLLTTEGAWYIRDKSCNRIYGEGKITGFGYLSTDIRNMPEGFEVHDAGFIPGLRDFLEGIVSDNSFENIPVLRLLFSPALYIWIMFLYMHSLVVSKRSRQMTVILFLLMYFLTLMLSPAILVRYIYPYMLLAFLPALKDTDAGENKN